MQTSPYYLQPSQLYFGLLTTAEQTENTMFDLLSLYEVVTAGMLAEKVAYLHTEWAPAVSDIWIQLYMKCGATFSTWSQILFCDLVNFYQI